MDDAIEKLLAEKKKEYKARFNTPYVFYFEDPKTSLEAIAEIDECLRNGHPQIEPESDPDAIY